MPRPLPNVAGRFADETQRSLDVAATTEALWLTAPPTGSVRQQLRVGQLEALYEAVFLRVFASWENVLESLALYYLAGYASPTYTPRFTAGVTQQRTIRDARAVLFGHRSYLLWHNPQQVIDRISALLIDSPVEKVLVANKAVVEDFAAVRHGIAHASDDAKTKARRATLRLCGTEHATAGRFLRTARLDDPLNQTKWLLVGRNQLVEYVQLMTA